MPKRQGLLIARLLDQPLGLTLEQYIDPMVPIVASHDLGKLDLEFADGVSRHGISGSSVAVAARFSAVALINPAGSRVSVELEGASGFANATSSLAINVLTSADITLLANQAVVSAAIISRNTEFGITAASQPGQATVIEGDAAGAFGPGLERILTAAARGFEVFHAAKGLRLSPGSMVVMGGEAVLQQIEYQFHWREVPIAQNAR